jgi:prolyl oligopeptidase
MKYPPAPRTSLIETIHGVPVADPFRTLEQADDPATTAWVEAENALTRSVLDAPMRERLVARLRELHRVPRASVPAVRGSRLFYTFNDGTLNQPVLKVNDRILLDPNAIDAAGTTAVTAFEPDERGARVVYALSQGGSDVQELKVRDAETGADLQDVIQWAKFASIAWQGDGFFYTRYPAPGTVPAEQEQYFCQVWFHPLGRPQSDDRLVYHRPDLPQAVFEVEVTSDGRHLAITSRMGASDDAEVHVIDLAHRDDVRPLVTGFTAGWHFIDGEGDHLYFHTDAGAPFGQVVRIDLAEETPKPLVVVPESEAKIEDVAVANGRLLVSSLHNAASRLESWSLDGRDRRTIDLPGIGSIVGIGARWNDPRSFVTFTSFTMPPTLMEVNDAAGRAESVGWTGSLALPFDPAAYVTEQVWYPSKDGTPISMFLVSTLATAGRPEGLRYESRADSTGGGVRDGGSAGLQACRVLLSGYGGFNISLTPAFDPSDFLWLDTGGTLAVANLRGGGEYGDAWHRAGMRERKQTVFDDFIAAAEWLTRSGHASPGQIAIEGGSNGGLLVAVAMVQRPDLFGAVVCRVPVADMLRYHLFTVGRFWIPEYGCADDPNDFAFLYRYSPYHNVAGGIAYPPTLVMTADTDDRVAPGMAKKFAARLQEAVAAEGGPILLRVETRAGHGAGKPISKQIDEQADIYAFLFNYLTGASASEQ